MSTRVEAVAGIPIPKEQVEFGKRVHGIIEKITTKLINLPSFQYALAIDFFTQQSTLRDSRKPLPSITFTEGGDLFNVGYRSERVDAHGFSPDQLLFRSHLVLNTCDIGNDANEQWQAVADIDSHFLKGVDGEILKFTGGGVRFESGYVLDGLGKTHPTWRHGRPTTSLEGVGAIEVLARTFSGLGIGHSL